MKSIISVISRASAIALLLFTTVFLLSAVVSPCLKAADTDISKPQPPPLFTDKYELRGKIRYDSCLPNQQIAWDDSDGNRRSMKCGVESWKYRVLTKNPKEVAKELTRQFKETMKDLPTKVLGTGKKLTTLQFTESKTSTLYVEIEEEHNCLKINNYRKRQLVPGQSLEFDFSETRRYFCFHTESNGENFGTLTFDSDSELLSLVGYKNDEVGTLRQRCQLLHKISQNHGPHHELYSIPQLPGNSLYKLDSQDKGKKGHLKITFTTTVPITKIPASDVQGGLIIKGSSWGKARVENEFYDQVYSPLFKKGAELADRTPQGDDLFWLPAGYWKVTVPPAKGLCVNEVSCHMIPVHGGKITTVEMPSSLASAFALTDEGRLEIVNIEGSESESTIQASLIDNQIEGLVPSIENTTVKEDGALCPITSIEPVKTPLDIVLLLDSSGSMKGSMRQALDSVRQFINILPEDAKIRIVDFDTSPIVLPGKNKEELLQSLKKVRARGATCLYDSIITGLKMLEDSKRPALIVFTDGVDANWNDTRPGSKATKSQVLQKAKTASLPIFTIGFGSKPDRDTLKRVAAIGGGTYYEGANKEALDKIFKQIHHNLNQQFTITCKRPLGILPSNDPVVSFVVDYSGSMDASPKRPGCDYRIEKVRQILKKAALNLPEETMGQVLKFSDHVFLIQALTTEKTALLRAFSSIHAYMGTAIYKSVLASLKTLVDVPSNRRYLIYITDAALGVKKKQQQQFNTLLGKLADSGINCLWVGICAEDTDGVFAHAAKLSKGKAIVSTDLQVIGNAIDEFIATIGSYKEKATDSGLSLQIKHRYSDGRITALTAQKRESLPEKMEGNSIAKPDAIQITVKGDLTPFDGDMANVLCGNDIQMKDVRVQKRMELSVSGKNKALKLEAEEAFFLTRLKGIDPPTPKRFLALKLNLNNILPSQKVAITSDGSNHPSSFVAPQKAVRYENKIPDYVIPDLSRHMFLRINNKETYPVSEATWLAESPLSLPGEPGVKITPEVPVSGAVIFVIPSENITQMSLHYFDTRYGHIDLPITGTMDYEKAKFVELPKVAPAKLSDAFSVRLNSYLDAEEVGTISAGKDCMFRVIDLVLTSQVQAHLEIDPKKRFTLDLPTHRGNLVFPLHPVTATVPLGFYRPSFVTPGATNTLKLVFRIPAVLAKGKNKGVISIDVKGGVIRIPLTPLKAPEMTGLKTPDCVDKGLKVYVHDSGISRGNTAVVEVSISDEKDDCKTRLREIIVLKRKDSPEAQAAFKMRQDKLERIKQAVYCPSGMSSFQNYDEFPLGPSVIVPMGESNKLFALNRDSVIDDGTTRRGLLFFELPKNVNIEDYFVSSFVLKNLNVPLKKDAKYTNKTLLIPDLRKQDYDDSSESFSNLLAKAVAKLREERKAKNFKKPGAIDALYADFSDKAIVRPLPCPAWSASVTLPSVVASSETTATEALEGLRGVLSKISLIPSIDRPWVNRFVDKSIWMQKWYTENEAAVMAEKLLIKEGIKVDRITVDLTKAGKDKLSVLSSGIKWPQSKLPALRYKTADHIEHVLVPPFLEELSTLKGLVEYSDTVKLNTDKEAMGRIVLSLGLLPASGGQNKVKAMAVKALGGANGSKNMKNFTIAFSDVPLAKLSNAPVHVGYAEIPTMDGMQLRAVFDSPDGRIVSNQFVDLSKYRVASERIKISTPRKSYHIERPLEDKENVATRFHTIAINIPDIPEDEARKIEATQMAAFKKAKNPDGLSALKWYGQSAIMRFVAAQTIHEKHLASVLDVRVARRETPRVILVNMDISKGKFNASMDLVHTFPDFVKGSKDAQKAFNIQSGMFDVILEGRALPEGKCIQDIWKAAPEGTVITPFIGKTKRALVEKLKEIKAPPLMVKALDQSQNMILFPSSPSLINGKPKWAWLEIDKNNYQTSSHFDTGEHGAMTEHILGNLLNDSAQFIIGAWKGVESSIWMVSSFALITPDNEQIMKNARLCLEGVTVSFGLSKNAGPASIGMDVGGGGVGASLGPLKIDVTDGKLMPNQNVLGFANGYKAGIAAYFDR